MFILIKDNKTITPYILNGDIDYKGIKIYKSNDSYYISLGNGLYFSDDSKHRQLEVQEYEIVSDDIYYPIKIYVYESDKGFDDYELYENSNFIIANDDKANIRSYDNYLNNYYLSIINGTISTNYDISVNGSQYDNERLSDDDVIEYLGIRIIYFDDYLYINKFNCLVNLTNQNISEELIRYPTVENDIKYYLPQDIGELALEEIKEYKPVKRTDSDDFIKSIMPNVIMCLSMSTMAAISYLSGSNQAEISKLSYMVMPVSMILTGLFLPLIFLRADKYKYKQEYEKNKSDYIEYLSAYQVKLNSAVSAYIQSSNSRFFELSKARDRLFYASEKSTDFMKLSVGKVVVSKDIEIKYSQDRQIDDILNNIEDNLNNIEDYPLFVSIKDNKIMTIVSKKNNKLYTFYRVLLELSFKHHFDDLNIAIYSRDDSIFDKIYNLPHLFVNKRRLTVTSEKQIQELDRINTGKPVILLMYEKIEYAFSNDDIHIIYFSDDISDLYKGSEAVVEYINNKGYLHKDGKKEFTYIEQHVDFDIYFDYLGKLKSSRNNSNTYKISDIYDLNIIKNYLRCDKRLNAYFAYSNSELLSFDLHESKQGPHGLIGGATGSGKSELIISLLLSLCIRYSPEYLNIVLIDYKGGGIKESLTYNNKSIPHIVASISNLENNALNRLIICLNNECKKRQQLFKQLSKYTGISIMSLDDYLNSEYEKYNLRNLANLIIVVDEFAELKKENPEQIKELISLSRIGRSLGLHLILATQKPSGVIDDEIWSNSRFKIALKVFEEKDSQDLIKNKNAAYLCNPGEFLLSVDNGLIKAKSIYSKTDINDRDPYKVSLLDNTLSDIAAYKLHNENIITEASIYCKNIIEAAYKMRLKPYILNFLPPHNKNRKSLTDSKCLVLGEVDDYINGYRRLLAYEININILIYSCRKHEINSILNTLNECQRKSIVISNNEYTGEYISDCIDYDNNADINYLFNYLNTNHHLEMTVVIEDINCFLSYDDAYLDNLCKLIKRSDILGINLIFITTSTQISFKLINSFKTRVLIGTNDKSDLSAFFSVRSSYIGDSYYMDDEVKCFIPLVIERYHESLRGVASVIRHIPEKIEAEINGNSYLLGYDKYSREKIYAESNVVICSMDEELLKIYRDSYQEMNVRTYSHGIDIENKDILWLGSGIFNQRLFVSSLKDDLDNDEGLYIKGSRKYIIRSLNHV